MGKSNTVQVAFRGRDDSVGLNVDTWTFSQDADWSQDVDTPFRVRIEVEENAGGTSNLDAQLEYNHEGGGWNAITGASSVVRAVSSSQFTNGDTITSNLLTSGSGTFVNGEGSTDGLTGTINLSNTHTEVEFCIQIIGDDVTNDDVILLRVTDAGTPIDSYGTADANQPVITVNKSAPIISVGQPQESNSAFFLIGLKSRVPGQSSELDSSLAVTSIKSKAIGQAVEGRRIYEPGVYEVDIYEEAGARPITPAKSRIIGQVSESNSAFTITPPVGPTSIGQPSETDSAFAFSALKSKAINQASESDSATATSKNKTSSSGQANEADSSFAVTVIKTVPVSQAIETDAPQSISWSPKNRLLSQSAEVDSAHPHTSRKSAASGQSSEADAALAVTVLKTKVIGQASEADSALSISSATEIVEPVAQASETDIGQSFQTLKSVAIGQASESDSALTFAKAKSIPVNQGSETDISFAITAVKSLALGQVSETDTVQLVVWAPKIRVLGQASEADSALSVTSGINVILGQAVEGANRVYEDGVYEVGVYVGPGALPITALKTIAIGQASEVDSAFTVFMPQPPVAVGQASESDSAQSLTSNKTKIIGLAAGGTFDEGAFEGEAFERESNAQPITVLKTIVIAQASESDSAFSINIVGGIGVLDQAVETDTALSVTSSKAVATGQSSETDSAFTLITQKTSNTGNASESNSAFAITALKTAIVGQVSESDTSRSALALGSLSQASESNSAFAVKATKSHIIGQPVETGLAFALTVLKTLTIGQATETDAVQGVSWTPKHRLIGAAQETDTARSILPLGAINPASESDSAFAISVAKTKVAGQSVETGIAFALTAIKTIALGQAVETDTARTMLALGAIGQTSESDIALAVASAKARAIGQTSEADTALAMTAVRSATIGQTLESDSAFALSKAKVKTVSPASETDTALSIAVLKTIAVGQASESDSAFPVSESKSKTAGQASEANTAFALTVLKTKTIAQASESSVAQAFFINPMRRLVRQALETNASLHISITGDVALATETDIAQAITVVKPILVGRAQETDSARALVWAPKIRVAEQPSETDEALTITVVHIVVQPRYSFAGSSKGGSFAGSDKSFSFAGTG